MVKAASVSVVIQGLAAELGIHLRGAIEINSDASAAIGISNRIGSGKVRHIELLALKLATLLLSIRSKHGMHAMVYHDQLPATCV